VFGVGEPLGVRLERLHREDDVAVFRLRQIGWSVASAGAAALPALSGALPAGFAVALVAGAPLLVFLVVEQGVANASAAWQRRLVLELPVVAEQLAMLIGAGYSLGAALQRIARRGAGCAARDLARVCARIGQGVGETTALREWAEVARVDAVDRLVAVLAMHRDGADLGRLLAEEARAIRRDVQRDVVRTVERRAQQVWIPVTVATLLPGVVFLAVPFVGALRVFGRS
jgi:Flp pilus assembly protein TadB